MLLTERKNFTMGARLYDPETGRFLSVDPLCDKFPEQNAYNYCFNNPLTMKDPSGLEPEDEKGEKVMANDVPSGIYYRELAKYQKELMLQNHLKMWDDNGEFIDVWGDMTGYLAGRVGASKMRWFGAGGGGSGSSNGLTAEQQKKFNKLIEDHKDEIEEMKEFAEESKENGHPLEVCATIIERPDGTWDLVWFYYEQFTENTIDGKVPYLIEDCSMFPQYCYALTGNKIIGFVHTHNIDQPVNASDLNAIYTQHFFPNLFNHIEDGAVFATICPDNIHVLIIFNSNNFETWHNENYYENACGIPGKEYRNDWIIDLYQDNWGYYYTITTKRRKK